MNTDKTRWCAWVRFGFKRWHFVYFHDSFSHLEAFEACRAWIRDSPSDKAAACRADLDGEMVVLQQEIRPIEKVKT